MRTVRFSLTGEDYVEYFQHLRNSTGLQKSINRRVWIRLFWFIAMLVVGACAVIEICTPGNAARKASVTATALGSMALGCLMLVPLALMLVRSRHVLNTAIGEGAARGDFGPIGLEQEATISDGDFSVRSQDGESMVYWHAVEAVERTPNLVLLRISKAAGHIIPMRAFSTPQEAQEFTAEAESLRKSAARTSKGV